MHPRSRVHLVVVKSTRVTTSTPKSPGIPARNGFNGFLRALPGDRALLPPSPCGLKVLSSPVEPNEPPQDLTPASRRQDHTTSPSASSAVVLHAANRSRRAIRPALASHAQHCCVHRISSRVRDDRDTPLVWDETAAVIEVIWVGAEQQNFLLWDSTAAITPNLARRAGNFFTQRHSSSRRLAKRALHSSPLAREARSRNLSDLPVGQLVSEACGLTHSPHPVSGFLPETRPCTLMNSTGINVRYPEAEAATSRSTNLRDGWPVHP
jgi:hypothetical protein